MRAWLRLALRPLGCEVVEVGTGVDLLDQLAEVDHYDAVITDVRMPGPDGIRVVAMARAAGLATPFLVITAFPELPVVSAVARMPDTALLAKPFAVDELRTALLALLPPRRDGAPDATAPR